ncbi:hypothetical protein HAX54_031304 [Datura stramonium]|uniref:Uncharacterized protein n=1 Tax=Datura stramonium TaxID=4076 RepID=A0ABS8VA92_DATST|nr:hypothetical protein [Datura stramonium]
MNMVGTAANSRRVLTSEKTAGNTQRRQEWMQRRSKYIKDKRGKEIAKQAGKDSVSTNTDNVDPVVTKNAFAALWKLMEIIRISMIIKMETGQKNIGKLRTKEQLQEARGFNSGKKKKKKKPSDETIRSKGPETGKESAKDWVTRTFTKEKGMNQDTTDQSHKNGKSQTIDTLVKEIPDKTITLRDDEVHKEHILGKGQDKGSDNSSEDQNNNANTMPDENGETQSDKVIDKENATIEPIQVNTPEVDKDKNPMYANRELDEESISQSFLNAARKDLLSLYVYEAPHQSIPSATNVYEAPHQSIPQCFIQSSTCSMKLELEKDGAPLLLENHLYPKLSRPCLAVKYDLDCIIQPISSIGPPVHFSTFIKAACASHVVPSTPLSTVVTPVLLHVPKRNRIP